MNEEVSRGPAAKPSARFVHGWDDIDAMAAATSSALDAITSADINSDAFGGEDDPECIASKRAWDNDIASFRAALLRAQGAPNAGEEDTMAHDVAGFAKVGGE